MRIAFTFLLTLFACQTAVAQTWTPPIGIPRPEFGISDAKSAPSPWAAEVAGYYYVDRTHGSATDSGNTYGHPGRPRATVPSTLPAGSYVEIRGTGYTTPSQWTLQGTQSAPVFVYGRGSAKPEFRGSQTELTLAGQWFVIDGIKVVNTKVRFGNPSGGDAHHAVLRRFELTGWGGSSTTAMIGFHQASSGHHNNVIFDSDIHDNGPVQISGDVDQHGVNIGPRNSRFFLLDSRLYRNTGDGMQINAADASAQNSTHHIYVGGNTAWGNKQAGFWSKQAVDVIFSENLVYNQRPSDSSPGACMGFQYAPQRVWFLYNHLHDCEYGIYAGGDSGLGNGVDSYFIGNVIHNIHHSDSYNPNTSSSQAAIMLRGGRNRAIVNNTIYDVNAGINIATSTGGVRIVNNIIANITQAQGNHIFIENHDATASSTMQHNLLTGTARIKWGDSTVRDLTGFMNATGQGQGSISGDPRFVNPAADDFRLQTGSPAIDRGTTDSVYATFQSLYGLSIAMDPDGRPRPGGAAYDIGAFEGVGSGAPSGPSAPANLRIIPD